jgi:hypothetical protein
MSILSTIKDAWNKSDQDTCKVCDKNVDPWYTVCSPRCAGKLGGQAGRGHTFAHGKVDPTEAGRKGGQISRRTK